MKEVKAEIRAWSFIREQQAAELLGVEIHTLKDWRFKGCIDNKGTLPPKAYIKGEYVFYDLNELRDWVLEGSVEPVPCSNQRSSESYNDMMLEDSFRNRERFNAMMIEDSFWNSRRYADTIFKNSFWSNESHNDMMFDEEEEDEGDEEENDDDMEEEE